ncbi:unnamed protein product [Caenorhabditis angaria]|uniref:Protein kinase domain-containing protein n=1 Tax=Caenorhabditis angaria TaxID=860376 RepID=A0A9P1IRQ5_9PELO|nr:unnamed protein product [Caenorhabditis angaria]
MKERLMQHAEPVVYLVVPEGFKKIVDLLYPMTYESAPDYSKIFEILDEICQTNNFDKTKCDWVGKFNNSMVSQKAIDDAANKTEDNICSGADDFEFGPKKKPKITRKMMNPGDQIKNGRFVWKIVNLLGSGGFGDVYRVFSETDKKKKNYALKTESEDGKKMMLRLKVEMQVLMAIQDDRKTNKKAVNKHFVEFVDRGKSDELKCKFIVMSIVGPSLDDCRKKYRVDLSHRSTPYNIAIQTLEAVRDLHNLGFLHRDIKPANFAVGIGSEEPVVYMLDFGICRMFIDPKTKIHRAPRKKVKFLGTLRFASRACLKCEDQGRKDDLECWLYMVFDILDEDDGIPWKNISDRDKILGVKMAFFLMKLSIVYENISRQMKTIVKYVDSLEYQSTPDYEYIIKSLLAVAEHCKCPVKDRRKVEWAGKLRKEDLEAIKRFDENSDDESEESAGSNESE